MVKLFCGVCIFPMEDGGVMGDGAVGGKNELLAGVEVVLGIGGIGIGAATARMEGSA